ncbi:serine protease [Vibrio sp. Isolate25]|uniref:S1 family peptidase n=1 Tax=Vibrio sp. Isolate25 TaxID=2908535 RepID=UPI001EFE24BD|nr:serine protease [Vibrio sp. Isolate25]MCG9595369.1 serine protease [Vibrio sp. Isolate25]
MKKIPLLVGLAATFQAYAADVTPYIVNGTDISATKYPSFVSLFYDRLNYDGVYSTSPYCGATLLDSSHVLTAAHCVYGSEEAQLFTSVVPQLQYETDFPYSVIARVMVSEYYYPDDYNDDTLANDIAILKLSSPITAVSDYVQLAVNADEVSYRVTPSVDFYAVGHGNTQQNIDWANSLQETQLSFIENSDCQVYSNADTSNNLCMTGAATSLGLDNATCQGDSGGPLYWNNKQVGITSFGPTTCGDTSIEPNSVFTEVTHHSSWIQSVLDGNELPKATATDAKRNSFLNPSSSGGGSLGFLSFLFIGATLFRRKLTS